MKTESPFEYEVCLSYARKDKYFVRPLAAYLAKQGIKFFYDEDEQATTWGKDLAVFLTEIYLKKSRYCVLFISKHYEQSLWTNQEKKSALARAILQREEYILPFRLDDTEIPGILPTTAYLSIGAHTPESLGQIIIEKLKGIREPGAPTSSILARYKNQMATRGFDNHRLNAELRKALERDADHPELNLLFCISCLKEINLTSSAASPQMVKDLETRIYCTRESPATRATGRVIQALIHHDFYKSRQQIKRPTYKEVFQEIIQAKEAPDGELTGHLIMSENFKHQLKQILQWVK